MKKPVSIFLTNVCSLNQSSRAWLPVRVRICQKYSNQIPDIFKSLSFYLQTMWGWVIVNTYYPITDSLVYLWKLSSGYAVISLPVKYTEISPASILRYIPINLKLTSEFEKIWHIFFRSGSRPVLESYTINVCEIIALPPGNQEQIHLTLLCWASDFYNRN